MKNNRQNPISNSTEDKLNRNHFVNYVTNIIKNAPVKSKSFTIAINGKWGEGKTSVKNLIIEKLLYNRKSSNDILLEFNSLEFQTQNDLNKIFLDKVINVIKNKKESKSIFYILIKNKKYMLYTVFILLLISGIIYPNIAIRFSSLFISILFIFKTQIRKITIASIMDVVSRFYIKVDVMHKILYYDTFQDNGAKNIKLIKYLETKCPYDRIIIFIDNFDSLEINQLKMLIQLINAKLDLPKLVFVLFYDKYIIENCLTTNVYNGSDFIEKFVNIQLDLPLITDDILFTFLQGELLEKYGINIKYLNEFKYIKNYFLFLNKIYSFLDTFDLNYTLMLNNLKYSNFLFNKKDFFLLEVLRFFENDLYRIIRKSKRILTKHSFKINIDKNKIWLNITNNIKNNNEENIRELLLSLFPYLAVQFDMEEAQKYSDEYLIENRGVGYFDYFDYYFIYEMNEIVITEDNFNSLKKYLDNNNDFINNFKKIFSINDDSNIHQFAESVLRKLFKRIDDIDILSKIQDVFEKQREFLKNIIWIYIYSNRNITSEEYLVNILLNYCRKNTFDNLIEILQLILNELNYFNYFYVVEFLNIIKYNLIEILFEQKRAEIERYKHIIDEIIYKYVNLIFENDNILEYLSNNTFNSRLQIYHIITYFKNKIMNKNNNQNFVNDTLIASYLKSKKFHKFKNSIFNNYFDLLYIFTEYSIKKKIIDGNLYLFLDIESLYPFTLKEILEAFKKRNVPRKDKIFNLLLKSYKEL